MARLYSCLRDPWKLYCLNVLRQTLGSLDGTGTAGCWLQAIVSGVNAIVSHLHIRLAVSVGKWWADSIHHW